MSVEAEYGFALSHFEPSELLDTLSTGIVVLDGQLCLIYGNVSAQNLMAVSVKQARGRPFGDLFHDSRILTGILKRSLERLETCTQHELQIKALGSPASREPNVVDLIVTPLEEGITGTYLLVELADATQRQRISRDSDILASMDGSRLMIRQLAHEIKNLKCDPKLRQKLAQTGSRYVLEHFDERIASQKAIAKYKECFDDAG